MSFYLVSCWKCLIAMSGVSELCTAAWAPEMLLLRLSVSLWVSQEMFGGGCEPCEDKRVRAGSPVCEQHRLQRARESGRAGSRELKIIHPYHGTAAHWAELLFWTCYAISTCWDCSVLSLGFNTTSTSNISLINTTTATILSDTSQGVFFLRLEHFCGVSYKNGWFKIVIINEDNTDNNKRS